MCPIEGQFVHYETMRRETGLQMIQRYSGLEVIDFDLDCFHQG